MSSAALEEFYRAYIDCLNRQDWSTLGQYVHGDVSHNTRRFGLNGYRAMLENDFAQIPDLKFIIALMVCDEARIAARLMFDCSPKGEFQGLPVNGRRVRFAEHVIYEMKDGKISQVWSMIDVAAIAAQLQTRQ